ERDPVLHAIAEKIGDDLRVLSEPLRRIRIQPAAAAIELVRKIPVEERDERRDAGVEQAVDELIVKGEAALVDGTDAIGQHARPGDAQAIRLKAELLHDRNIFAP